MNILIMVGQLILGLSILVILHELGHFLAARAFKIRVEKFYLFFDAGNFKLFSFKKGETEYGIGWLPLGGYVKISGMIDESMDKEQLKLPPQPWEFRSRPAWQRLIVMVAGVFVNLILGILIFGFTLLQYEKSYLPLSEVNKDGIYASSKGKEIGFETGDKIISINGKPIERFKDAQSVDVLFGSTFEVERNGKIVSVEIPEDFYRSEASSRGVRFIEPLNFPFRIDSVIPALPAANAGLAKSDKMLKIDSIEIKSYGQFKELISTSAGRELTIQVLRGNDTLQKQLTVDSSGIIGILASIPYTQTPYDFGKALSYGYKDAMDMLSANIKGLGKIISGEEKASESLQGPIGIAQIYGSQWIWAKFWYITGLLSLILAFMNILPIPALDGGHVLFLLIEIVTRRKPSDKVLEYAQMAGMIILLGIMVFAIGNDIMRIFR
ncbi:MAG TPA: RIP metalloprotease RseP [Bacteroidales bacterium]|nr:RIP metalloprotease RseP [Bacteroidales bacterium]